MSLWQDFWQTSDNREPRPLTFAELRKKRLGEYTAHIELVVHQTAEQVFSANETANEIRMDSRNPFINLIPEPWREQAIEMMTYLRQLVEEETMIRWQRSRHWIESRLHREEEAFQEIAELNQESRKLRTEERNQRLGQIRRPQSSIEVIPIKEEIVRDEVESLLEAKDLKRMAFRKKLKVYFYSLLMLASQAVDSGLVFLIMVSCFAGTEGYSVWLAPLLTAAVLGGTVFLAHLGVSNRGWLAKVPLLVMTGVLGYMRLEIGGIEKFDWTSLNLAVMLTVPIPIFAYLAVLALRQAKKAEAEAQKLQEKSLPLSRQRLVTVRTARAIEKNIQSQTNAVVREERLTIKLADGDLRQRQGVLDRIRGRFLREARQIESEFERFQRRQIGEVLKQVSPITQVAIVRLTDWSLEEEEKEDEARAAFGDRSDRLPVLC